MDRIELKEHSEYTGGIKEILDIYSGEEKIRFNNRHPIFKTLMKLEFEDILRSFSKKKPNSYL
jgi:hypothetical protein